MPHKCADCGKVHPDNSDSILKGCEECGGNRFQFIHRDPIELDTTVDFDDPDEDDIDEDKDKEELIEEFLERKEDEEDASAVETEPVDATNGTDDADEEESSGGATEVRRSSSGLGADADGVRRIRNERPDTATADEDEADAEPSTTPDEADTDDQPSESEPEPVDDSPTESDPVEADDPEPVDAEPVDAPEADAEAPSAAESDEGEAGISEAEAFGYQAVTDVEEVADELNRQFESIKVLEPGKYALNPMAMYENEEFVVALEEDGQYRIEPVSRYGESE